MKKLENKVAVITGGNSGIGFATAKAFIEEGAKVVITGRNQDALNKAVVELGENAVAILADVSVIGETIAMAEKVKSMYGKVDILFVNAGVSFLEPVGQISEETYERIMDINFKGAVFTTEKVLPLLSSGASVIHLSSVSSFAVGSGTAIYAASKAALNAYSRTAAIELASRQIRVNVINPGMVNTPLAGKAGIPEKALDEIKAYLLSKMPFRRFAQPDEIAKLAVFLASDDASFISGAEYNIDGAQTVNEPFRA
ncbi:SDR family oxidoreductase [Pedobacter petrophilus]|uniref:SDR family oxidoreductase n=2 Tax=Pedobacter TaxID=84567 RepID=A0A7K0G4J8_9SPHI|nr:SDR family oxidoreductase [Pedobacter petrophilus]MRX78562.1 SDR family oxidoreductase [Pedobacter petrophilus]